MIASFVAFAHLAWTMPRIDDGALTAAQQKAAAQKAKEQERFQKELEDDKKQGKEAADFYDREYKLTKDTKSQQRVEEIGAKLALIANANQFEISWGDKRHSEFEYKFKVVDNKDINAFSLPGGYIYVYQGLIDFVQSDDELAGVLAHEINHASQRHVAVMRREQERMAPIQIPLILATIFSKGADNGAGLATGQLLGTALTNGWSVKAETSADFGGVQLLVAGGYDATGMLTFMERLQAKESALDGVDLGIFRTHPPSKARADKIEEYMKKNAIPIRRSLVAFDFRVNSKPLDNGATTLYFGKRKLFAVAGNPERANTIMKTLNAFFDKVPEMYDVTTGDDGVIYSKNRLLIAVTPEDAKANGMEMEQLQNSVAKAIRSSIFSLAYHIWEGRN